MQLVFIFFFYCEPTEKRANIQKPSFIWEQSNRIFRYRNVSLMAMALIGNTILNQKWKF